LEAEQTFMHVSLFMSTCMIIYYFGGILYTINKNKFCYNILLSQKPVAVKNTPTLNQHGFRVPIIKYEIN